MTTLSLRSGWSLSIPVSMTPTKQVLPVTAWLHKVGAPVAQLGKNQPTNK
jgi:hypothetical protein